MASHEHEEILRQGTKAVERWRKEHPHEILDLKGGSILNRYLSGINLSGANLSGASLNSGRLPKADLSGADLSGADLSYADLSFANLTGADLSDANMFETRLVGADLSYASLFGADLVLAVLIGTRMLGTEFDGALLGSTIFGDCDLSQATGLESVVNIEPSVIGMDTVLKSVGSLPEQFLRNAGLPDVLLEFVQSLDPGANRFYTCFISFTKRDEAFAEKLHRDLKEKGVSCWFYPESAAWGRRTWDDIYRNVRKFDKVIVVCSEASLNSPAVLEEIELALDREADIARSRSQHPQDQSREKANSGSQDPDVLFPIQLDNYILDGWEHHRKTTLKLRNIGDFVDWDKEQGKYEHSLNRLIGALST